jgi:hypothetical protein
VTVRDFTLAKLLVNVPVFGALWLTTAAAFSYAFGLGLLPLGAVPMMTMILLGVFAGPQLRAHDYRHPEGEQRKALTEGSPCTHDVVRCRERPVTAVA